MKIVYATPFFRVPPDFGLAIRNYHILEHLTQHHRVIVITTGIDPSGETDQWLSERCEMVLRVPISRRLPQSHNKLDILQRLLQYPPGSFRRISQQSLNHTIQQLQASVPDIDLYYFDTQLTGQVALRNPTLHPAVLSLADINSEQWRRRIATTGWRPYTIIFLTELLKTRYLERQIFQRFHNIITVSTKEFATIQKQHPNSKVALIPNGVNINSYRCSSHSRTNNTLLFVGCYDYGPNKDAFFYFCKEILPLIHEVRPDVKLIALGRNPSADMIEFASHDARITIPGTVHDVRPFYQHATLSVIPLRLGSGTKLKTLEAFAMNTPVVSTMVGAEGIKVNPAEHFLLAEEPEEFARKTIWLLDHPQEASKMAKRARERVVECYDWSTITGNLEQHLLQIAREVHSRAT